MGIGIEQQDRRQRRRQRLKALEADGGDRKRQRRQREAGEGQRRQIRLQAGGRPIGERGQEQSGEIGAPQPEAKVDRRSRLGFRRSRFIRREGRH